MSANPTRTRSDSWSKEQWLASAMSVCANCRQAGGGQMTAAPDLQALNALQEPARGEPDTAQQSFAKPIDAFTAQRVMKQPPADPLGLF